MKGEGDKINENGSVYFLGRVLYVLKKFVMVDLALEDDGTE